MNFICDFVFVLIIFLSSYIGHKKGFVKTFFGFFESLLSLIVTLILVNPISDFISGNFVLPVVTKSVEAKMPESFSLVDVSSISNSDSVFYKLIEKFGLKNTDIQNFANGLSESGEEFKHKVAEFIATPLANLISLIIAFILVFIVVKIILKVVALLLDLVTKLPFLKTSNKFLGLTFGILRGVLIAFMYARIISMIEPVLQSSEDEFLSQFQVSGTFLINFVSNINPLNIFINF